jgi:hypothetical protein
LRHSACDIQAKIPRKYRINIDDLDLGSSQVCCCGFDLLHSTRNKWFFVFVFVFVLSTGCWPWAGQFRFSARWKTGLNPHPDCAQFDEQFGVVLKTRFREGDVAVKRIGVLICHIFSIGNTIPAPNTVQNSQMFTNNRVGICRHRATRQSA